jgi:hypothetical protein
VSSHHSLYFLLYVLTVPRVPVLKRRAYPEPRLRERLGRLPRRTFDVTVYVAGQIDGLLEGFENRSSESGLPLSHTPNGHV